MSSIDNLKKEAKRRLKALRVTDPRAALRAVQQALAREHGFDDWQSLRTAVEGRAPGMGRALAMLRAAERGTLAPDQWLARFAALLRDRPNAVRAGYLWSDLIVIAAAKAPGYAIEALMRHGAAANVQATSTAPDGTRGLQPLHNAARHGNADAAAVLLRYGADPAARDAQFQRTAAEWAEAGGHLDLRDRLLEATRDLLERRREARSTRDPAGLFLHSACWDHHVHGAGDHRMYDRAAQRLLAANPEIARAGGIYTAVVCGEIEEVRRILGERPDAAREPGGARGWTPLLYLCYTRFTHPPTLENAEAIARLLLDRGADPNDFYMAGDSQYTALVGAAGEGEQDSPRQPWAVAVYRLLLERGAGPYDIQVLYNTHFSADMLWWLELTYDYSVRTGRQADWDDPAWRMLDMGGYGPGAYFVLGRAMAKNRLDVMQWALAHGADPNITSSDHPRFRPRLTLYDEAVLHGRGGAAELLRRHGARPAGTAPLEPWAAFVEACVRVDRSAAAAILQRHPELKSRPEPLFEAARLNRADVLAMLADLGYALDAADAHDTRALHHAAGANALDAARFLIERGVDPDPRETRWGATPIGWAAHSDHVEMVDFLSRYSRNIWTLGYRGYVERVRELLAERPERAREVTAEGVTPLWWLPDEEDKAMALLEMLIAAGADPSAKNAEGRTAADWARRRGMLAIARRLESGG